MITLISGRERGNFCCSLRSSTGPSPACQFLSGWESVWRGSNAFFWFLGRGGGGDFLFYFKEEWGHLNGLFICASYWTTALKKGCGIIEIWGGGLGLNCPTHVAFGSSRYSSLLVLPQSRFDLWNWWRVHVQCHGVVLIFYTFLQMP